MNALRRAIGRKDVIIGLLVFLVAGGWFGWRYVVRPALGDVVISLPQDPQTTQALQAFPGLADVRSLLDAGQYPQALARADGLVGQFGDQPAILSYKILAQLLTGNATAAAASGDAALTAGATGPDAAIALSAKALMAFERPDLAKPLALQALQQAAGTSQAALVSRVAFAAAVRAEYDLPKPPTTKAERAQAIEEALGPILSVAPTQPKKSAWQARFWRRGLALLADSYSLAAEAGDGRAALAAKALLRDSCPQDVWSCYFQIPDKAVRAARSDDDIVDDHARAATLTAVGFLYLGEGDRLHGDHAYRRAIQAYARLLEQYDDWDGPVMRTVTPQGQIKNVGQEFYTYRNRMERLVKHSADWWGIRVLDGRSSLAEALDQSEQRLFRAMVRVRADREADPVQIVREEHINPSDYLTVADWFAKRAHGPQATFERERAAVLARIGEQEERVQKAIYQARALRREGLLEDALKVLVGQLDPEPYLSETGTSLRCEMAWILMEQRRYVEALQLLADAEQVLEGGDGFAPFGQTGLRGRIRYYRMLIARSGRDLDAAIRQADALVEDAGIQFSLRARTLLDLVQMHIEARNEPEAVSAYQRLASLPVTAAQRQAFLDPIVRGAQSRLNQQGWQVPMLVDGPGSAEAGEPVAVADFEN